MAGAGMTPWGQIIGTGMQGTGLVMSGIGRSQGLKSMAGEAQRQSAEWEAENLVQQKAMEDELARHSAGMAMDRTAPELAARQGAIQGAGRLGANMGISAARSAQTQGALVPASTVAAQQLGAAKMEGQNVAGRGRMNTKLRQSKLDQEGRAALYEQLLQQAGNKGHWWRQGGDLMGQLGYVVSSTGGLGSSPGGGKGGGGASTVDMSALYPGSL